MKPKIFSFFFFTLAFICCTNKSINEPWINLKPLDQSVLFTDFSSIIDTCEIIELEETKKSLIVNVSKLLITNNKEFIVLSNSNIFLFERNGKFKFKIGNQGKGPGEYIRIYDICLNHSENKLLALDALNRVFVYSLNNGKHIQTIIPKFKEKISTCDAICSGDKNNFYLFCSNPLNQNDFKSAFNCLYYIDNNGKVLDESIRRVDLNHSPYRFTSQFNNSNFLRPLEGDNILYSISGSTITKRMTIDFQNQTIPLKHIYSFGGNPDEHFQEYMKSKFFKMPMNFFETKKYFYFRVVGPDVYEYQFFFNKTDWKGIHWICRERFQQLVFEASDEEFFYLVLEPNTQETIKSLDNPEINQLRKYLLFHTGYTKLKSFNPSILKIRLKM